MCETLQYILDESSPTAGPFAYYGDHGGIVHLVEIEAFQTNSDLLLKGFIWRMLKHFCIAVASYSRTFMRLAYLYVSTLLGRSPFLKLHCVQQFPHSFCGLS